jgi:hypothetical protein
MKERARSKTPTAKESPFRNLKEIKMNITRSIMFRIVKHIGSRQPLLDTLGLLSGDTTAPTARSALRAPPLLLALTLVACTLEAAAATAVLLPLLAVALRSGAVSSLLSLLPVSLPLPLLQQLSATQRLELQTP